MTRFVLAFAMTATVLGMPAAGRPDEPMQHLPEPRLAPSQAPVARAAAPSAPNGSRLSDISFASVFSPTPRTGDVADPFISDATSATVPSSSVPGSIELKTAHWVAPQLTHRTLYFEDDSLERFGVSWGPCLQPIVSGWKFFLDIYRAPTRQHYQPPHAVQATLGYPRAGSPPDSVFRRTDVE